MPRKAGRITRGGRFGRTAHDARVDLTDDFHVYGVDWTRERITWRLDGEPYWPGNSSDDLSLPATMLIDWVRVRSSPG
jgi:hypothetical protein